MKLADINVFSVPKQLSIVRYISLASNEHMYSELSSYNQSPTLMHLIGYLSGLLGSTDTIIIGNPGYKTT